MSTRKTTHVDGDVHVENNVVVGGDGSISGGMTVGHNLKVEGWLEARNIRGVNKGVFPTYEALVAKYSEPQDGWYAGVAVTTDGETVFEFYLAQKGRWVDMESTIDSAIEVGTLQRDVEEMKKDVAKIPSLSDAVEAMQEAVSDVTEEMDALSEEDTRLADLISAEKTARAAGDEALSGRISAEATARADSDEELLARIHGTSLASDAMSDPFRKWSAPLTSWGDVVHALDALMSISGSEQGKKAAGRWRLVYNGRVIHVDMYAQDFEQGYWVQVVSGAIKISFSEGQISLGASNAFHCYWRRNFDNYEGTVGDAWTEATDDPIERKSSDIEIVNSLNRERSERTAADEALSDRISAVATARESADEALSERALHLEEGRSVRFGGFVEDDVDVEIGKSYRGEVSAHSVKWLVAGNVFAVQGVDEKWYASWNGSGDYQKSSGGSFVGYADKLYAYDGKLYMYDSVSDQLMQVGGSSVASIFNVTNEVPLQDPLQPYYTLQTATAAVWQAGKATGGMIITFLIGSSIWKTYQYVGTVLNETEWNLAANWKDFGSLAAGSETYIDINALVGSNNVYNLGTALEALQSYERSHNVSYAKLGQIIAFKTSEATLMTMQYQGDSVADFYDAQSGVWKPFGGGGSSDVETSDEPEQGGTDALSTGGAYTHIPVGIEATEVEQPEENTAYYQLVNAAGEGIGSPVGIPIGGGGGGTAAIFSIRFEYSPFYAAVGGDFRIRAAIRSLDAEGVPQTITEVRITDITTQQTVYAAQLDQASSASSEDYSFTFDLSSLFSDSATAQKRYLRLTARDAGGGTKSVQLTVVPIDLTAQITHPLGTAVALPTGGEGSVNLALYKFAKAASVAGGITARLEVYLDGGWREIGTEIVAQNTTKSYVFDIGSGEGCLPLTHGSYLLRLHGEAVVNGNVVIRGNYVYQTLMFYEKGNTVPLSALKWNDASGVGTIRSLEAMTVQLSGYTYGASSTEVVLLKNGEEAQRYTISQGSEVSYKYQVIESQGSVIGYEALAGESSSGRVEAVVSGSVIDAGLTEGAVFNFDFSSRTNDEPDHSIVSGEYSIELAGANWSSNGFGRYLGANALAVKENVTGRLNWQPFAGVTGEQSRGVLFSFATANVADNDAKLISCYDEVLGAGFYVSGRGVGIYAASGSPQVAERAFPEGSRVTVGIVLEDNTSALMRDGESYRLLKLFLNGELSGCIGIRGGQAAQSKYLTFDGRSADLYLYYIIGWQTYDSDFSQSFYDYLVKLTDTSMMVDEFGFEDVLTESKQVSMEALRKSGMPYLIEKPFNGSDVSGLDGTTSTKENLYITLEYHDPGRPWCDFVATDVRKRNQGTTSAKRPVKNARYYLAKGKGSKQAGSSGTTIVPFYTREEIEGMGYAGSLWDEAVALMGENKVRVGLQSIPVDIITVKVDYSDSSNANDCGTCNLMNATYRALGPAYMTPAQRYYDGTYDVGDVHLTGLELNHSTANHPIAMFRDLAGDGHSISFYAKGNWKEDKGEQTALGFKDTAGYNKGCLNYGDGSFVEYYGLPTETLAETEARFLADATKDVAKRYLLTQYCGSSYKFYRYIDGAWQDTTGTMRQEQGSWVITGDVLNPVDGYELRTYMGLCWWRGVASVEDMMRMVSQDGKEAPVWMTYFECMIDDDELQAAYEAGKKVPYWLYRLLRFANDCAVNEGWNGSEGDTAEVAAGKLLNWRNNLYKYANPRSLMVYYGFTDYLAATDQQAKNMQPMFFLDDGGEVLHGVYTSEDKVRMYPNKVYDADTLLGKDNDGGATVDAEVDPSKVSVEGVYTNPFAGWGSVLWRHFNARREYMNAAFVVSEGGETATLAGVISSMRSVQTTSGGSAFVPFSPAGVARLFVDGICRRWQKLVSSIDGQMKYIAHTSDADGLYFYALHGLRLTALPSFIETRFRIRDSYYGTGLFTEGSFTSRIGGSDGAGVGVTSAKDGCVGYGLDNQTNVYASEYLLRGESHRFSLPNDYSGALLYFYQCGRLLEADFSALTLDKDAGSKFSCFTLLQRLLLGSATHTEAAMGSYGQMTSFSSAMPFLRELDVRGTSIETLSLGQCPRLEEVLAEGSAVRSVELAPTSPVRVLSLPAGIKTLRLRHLPYLSYTGDATQDGLTLGNLAEIETLVVENCPQIDVASLLSAIVTAQERQPKLRYVRLTGLDVRGSSAALSFMLENGVKGCDSTGTVLPSDEVAARCSGVMGAWEMTDLVADGTFAQMQGYFPVLELLNSQYTGIMFNESMQEHDNITNLENGTTGSANYRRSGHIKKLYESLHAYTGVFDAQAGCMRIKQISDDDLREYADGTPCDVTGTVNSELDVFVKFPEYWYKGVEDVLNGKRYIYFSTLSSTPRSSARVTRRERLSDIMVRESASVVLSDIAVGSELDIASLPTDGMYNIYQTDIVEDMKRVRWAGVNSQTIGAAFLDAAGKVIEIVRTQITSGLTSYMGGDYFLKEIPAGAKTFVFTAAKDDAGSEVIAANTLDFEAMEPDWVKHEAELLGAYMISVDKDHRLHSLSAKSAIGYIAHSEIWSGWTYDAAGNVTNNGLPPSSTQLKYSIRDCMNLARLRGSGYLVASYETLKDVSNLYYAFYGARNSQALHGSGTNNFLTTGITDNLDGDYRPLHDTGPDTAAGLHRVRAMGLEDFWGAYSSVMDEFIVGEGTWAEYAASKWIAGVGATSNRTAHIVMPNGTERTTQIAPTAIAQDTTSSLVARVRGGRYCDILPAAFVNAAGVGRDVYYAACVRYYFTAKQNRMTFNIHGFGAENGIAAFDCYAAESGAFGGGRLCYRGTMIEE